MTFQRLPESVATLYAELLDLSIQADAGERAGGLLSGSFVRKRIKGRVYWYLQRSEGERKRQVYLGPDSEPLRRWIGEAQARRRSAEPDLEQRRRLCAMLRAGGAPAEPAAVVKVLRLLAEAGVFRLGGVLVGTLSFRTYAAVLGVRFARPALRTEDIDIGHDPAIGVALAREAGGADVSRAIAGSELGLLPVPALDPRRPSTSFKIRGRSLRVDFLTPMRGAESNEPVFLPAYRLSAQPVRHLDLLIERPIQAVVVGAEPVLVNLPDPARFALHKLLLSQRRGAAFHAKARKDIAQAAQLLEVLLEDRPSDLALAWEAVGDRPEVRHAIQAAAGHLDEGLRSRLDAVLQR